MIKEFKSRPEEFKKCILWQVEKSKALGSSHPNMTMSANQMVEKREDEFGIQDPSIEMKDAADRTNFTFSS